MGRLYIYIALVLAVLAVLASVAVFAQVTVTTTSVRYSFASDVTVTTYYVSELESRFGVPVAVFMRDGVLYVAYDNFLNGSSIVRLDTGEIVKTCSFGDYIRFATIVGGNGTAYGAILYYRGPVDGPGVFEFRYVDLWTCEVIAEITNASLFFTRENYHVFVYDVYRNRLVHVISIVNEIVNETGVFVSVVVIDIDEGSVRDILSVLWYRLNDEVYYYYIDSVLVTPDYYYIFVANASTGEPILMYVFDANLRLVSVTDAPITYTYYSRMWYGSAPIAYNRFGILYLKHIGSIWYGYRFNEIYRIVLCSNGFGNCIEYVTDLENDPGIYTGVVAYRDVFVVHGGGYYYDVERYPGIYTYIRVPYVYIFLPDKGLLINTSIAGFAVSVDYNLWRNNKIVVVGPYGYIYVIDPPVVVVTETYTVTDTVTTTVVHAMPYPYTVTETVTTTVVQAPAVDIYIVLIVVVALIVAAIIYIYRRR